MTHIFLHTQKTGGVTIKDMLSRQYDNIFDIKQFKDYDNRRQELSYCSREFQREIELIQGHQYFGIHRGLDQECKYFGLLRHPVDKIISLYKSYKRKEDCPQYENANNINLPTFIEKRLDLHFNNGSVRTLSDMYPDEVGYGDVENKHLEQAKRNLSKHFYMGIVEMFDESMVYLHHKLKWRKPPYYSRANSAKKKDNIEVDEETKKMIRRINHYDLELYYYAKSEFQERIKGIPNFDKRVKIFKIKNRLGKPFKSGNRIKRKIERMI